MTTSLAIAVPQVGLTSETFVQRHVEDLLPGRTVVLTRQGSNASSSWQTTRRAGRRPPRAWWRRLALDRERAPAAPDAARTGASSPVTGSRRSRGEYLDFALDYLAVRARRRASTRTPTATTSPSGCAIRWRRGLRRLNDADGVITVSRVSRDRLVALGIDATRIHVVPCGVDVPRSRSRERRAHRPLHRGRTHGR
jgi:glycosyltransferase involved in cell wall biosynthesis